MKMITNIPAQNFIAKSLKNSLLLSASAAAVLIGFALEANAWERNSTTTGPQGYSATSQAQGSCANGSCQRSRTVTGPYGNSATYQSSTTRTENGWTRQQSGTGPRGRSFNRSTNVTR